MHFFKTIVLSALVAVTTAATAQELIAEIPACAQSCVSNAAKEVGCDASDVKCQCGKLIEMTGKAQPCVTSACSFDDTTKAAGLLSRICASVAADVGGDAFNSAVSKISSAATAGASKLSSAATAGAGAASHLATSLAGEATRLPTATGTGATPTSTAGAGRNLAGAGFAAAVVALAL